jgi:hypothetical protein
MTVAGRLAVVPFALYCMLAAAPVAASSLTVPPGDGCQQLAATLGQTLHGTLRRVAIDPFQWPKRYSMMPMIVVSSPLSCGTTAATSSAAFSSTFAAYGIVVRWNNGDPDHADKVCLSHYISRCYPQLDDGSVVPSGADPALVERAWTGVQAGISQHMPFGPQSDLAYFQPEWLHATLEMSLAVSFAEAETPAGNTLQQRY